MPKVTRTRRSKAPEIRILGIDTSLSSPGMAVLEVRNRKATIAALFNVKTDAKQLYAERSTKIRYASYMFFHEHPNYDVIVRESFASRNTKIQYAVFTAWSAIDLALNDAGYRPVDAEVGPTEVKMLLLGKGKGRAEKNEVAERVRELTGYEGVFETDDQSDAAGIALAYLIKNNLIEVI